MRRWGKIAAAHPTSQAARKAGAVEWDGHNMPTRAKLRAAIQTVSADKIARPICHPLDLAHRASRASGGAAIAT